MLTNLSFFSAACEEKKAEVLDEKMVKEVKDNLTPRAPAPVKQEMTEEDLEDWLDSMISWPPLIQNLKVNKITNLQP